MEEGSKAENKEEHDPKEITKKATEAVKNKDAKDPVISSEWSKKAKETCQKAGVGVGATFALLLILCAKLSVDVVKFAKRAIEKGGNVGFGEGYKLGQEPPFHIGDKNKK